MADFETFGALAEPDGVFARQDKCTPHPVSDHLLPIAEKADTLLAAFPFGGAKI